MKKTRPVAALLASACAALLMSTLTPAGTANAAEGQNLTTANQIEESILFWANRKRENNGNLAPVANGTCVDTRSEDWATNLVATETLVHSDLTRILNDCNKVWAGENLIKYSVMSTWTPDETGKAIVNAWMGSASHQDVLLKPNAANAGVGVKKSSDGQDWYVVLNMSY